MRHFSFIMQDYLSGIELRAAFGCQRTTDRESLIIPDRLVLEGLVAERFRRPKPSWLSGLTGYDPTSDEYDPTIERIEPVDHGGFFRKHAICRLFVTGHFLEAALLPSLSSSGMFAFDGAALYYLNHGHQENLQRVLAAEGRRLEQADPYLFASILAEAVLRRDNRDHVVLRSADELVQYSGRRYKLDEQEFSRCADQIKPPNIAWDSRAGWSMTFWGLHGWMYEKQTLGRQEFRILTSFAIEQQEDILSRKIFSFLPRIMY